MKLAAFLESPPPRTVRCATCLNKRLAQACRELFEARKKGSTVSWSTFWKHFAIPNLGPVPGYSAMMQHVRNCLGGP